jgi:hypothetical protein
MVKYTDEELMMFCKEYSRNMGLYYFKNNGIDKPLESFKRDIVSNIDGIFYEVSNIPYEELPLYINDTDKWYKNCISIRLKIGR